MNKIETAKIVTIVFMATAVGAMTILASMSLVQQASAQQTKFFVVHRPPDNPDNARLLCVSPSAAEEHLAHGDSLAGICRFE